MTSFQLIVVLSSLLLSPRVEYDTPHEPCLDEFTFKVTHSIQGENNGSIELGFTNQSQSYTLKVFSVSHQIELIKTLEVDRLGNGKFLIEDLAPSNYLIKIEWGGTCVKTIGGIEGITIFDELR